MFSLPAFGIVFYSMSVDAQESGNRRLRDTRTEQPVVLIRQKDTDMRLGRQNLPTLLEQVIAAAGKAESFWTAQVFWLEIAIPSSQATCVGYLAYPFRH